MDVESPILKSRRSRRNSEESIMANQTIDQFGEDSRAVDLLGESQDTLALSQSNIVFSGPIITMRKWSLVHEIKAMRREK
jgi:hypothetical protein